MKTILALFTMLLFMGQTAGASTSATGALGIYQNSSNEIRMEQIATEMRKAYSNTAATTNTTRKTRRQIRAAIKQAWGPRTFQREITSAIERTLNADEQEFVLSWLDSSLGRKTALSEAIMYIEASRTDMLDIIEKSNSIDTDDKRKNLLKTINLASMGGDLQLDMTVHQNAAASFVANAPASITGISGYSTYFNATKARRNEMFRMVQNYNVAMVTHAYRDLSKRELNQVVSFWGSPTGTRYAVALREGIDQAFLKAKDHFIKELAYIMASNNINVAQLR